MNRFIISLRANQQYTHATNWSIIGNSSLLYRSKNPTRVAVLALMPHVSLFVAPARLQDLVRCVAISKSDVQTKAVTFWSIECPRVITGFHELSYSVRDLTGSHESVQADTTSLLTTYK